MSSKVKRKVTVESNNNETSDPSRRPSVFERLGPGAVTLNAPSQERHARNAEPGEKCRNWLRTGNCSYGSGCRYQHESYSSSTGRQRKTEREIDEKDLRYKVRNKRKDAKEPRSNVSPSPKKTNRKHAETRTTRKGEHENKLGLKSTVVITRPRTPVSDGEEAPQRNAGWEDDSDEWPMDASQLDYKEELTLEMKRQQLQKELEIELQKERMMNENVTITKPLSATASSSSSSSSRSSSSSSSSSSESKTASSSSESSSSEESDGERSSSSGSRSSSSSRSSFRKKGGAKALSQATSKSPKKQAKEKKYSRSSGHVRPDKSKAMVKQLQPSRARETVRSPQALPPGGHESRSRRRHNKGFEPKPSNKAERSVDDRFSGQKQRGPRTPSPTVPSHGKQWQGTVSSIERQEDKKGKNKRRKRRRSQAAKEPEPVSKSHSSATAHSASPVRQSGAARRHRHRDDSSVEKHVVQKSAPKYRGISPGRKHRNKSPLPPPPLSLPPKVAADTREHERMELRRAAALFNDSGSQSSTAGRGSKKSRKLQRIFPKISPQKPENSGNNYRMRDLNRDGQSGDYAHGGDRRGAGGANERGMPHFQQGRERHKEQSPSRDKEHRSNESGNKRLQNERTAPASEEPRWTGERGVRRVDKGRKDDERIVQRVGKASASNISGNVQMREQSGKRKNNSPGWDREPRPYEAVEAPSRYGDQKLSGRANDDRRPPERGRDKGKNDLDKDLEPPTKRRAISSERQRVSSHSGRDGGRQNSPPRSGQRPTGDTDKGEYSKNYKNEPQREDSRRSGDQRGFGGRHREQDFPLERPPLGEYGSDPYRDYRYSDADRDQYASSRRDFPHIRRGELEHESYGPHYTREEYYQHPPEDWDHYREFSANHEPLGPVVMMPTYRGSGRGELERTAGDRYRETAARTDDRLPSRDEEARSGRERRQRVKSPDWASRREERKDPSPVPPPPRPQSRSQDAASWERGSRHSSRGSVEGHKSSHRKEESKKTRKDSSTPSSNSSSSKKDKEKEKTTSKKETKEKSKSHREKEKRPSEEERKRRSRSKTPPAPPPATQPPPPAPSRSESRKEEKKKSSGDKSERRKTSSDEKRKKAPPPLAPPSPVPEKEIIRDEGEIKVEPMSPIPVDEPTFSPDPVLPAVPSPATAPISESPTSLIKDVISEKESPVPEADAASPKEEVLQISPSVKDEEAEDFSDWTDDEDDELLTRDEPSELKVGGEKDAKEKTSPSTPLKTEVLPPVVQEGRHEKRNRSKERSSRRRSRSGSHDRRSKDRSREDRPEKKEVLPRIDESAAPPSSRTESADPKEEDIDYDPISDDELEAMIEEPDDLGKEEENKTGLIDSLGVDWASLAGETLQRASFQPGNARKRFSTLHVLQRVGISRAWAGAELTQKVIDLCDQQLQKESAEASEPASERKRFTLDHPIAAFQVAAIEQRKARSRILHDMGPYRKALCARQDLFIRRQLCKVGIKGADSLAYNQQQQHVDRDLYKLSVEMFRRSRSNRNAMPPVPCRS